jgi:hypothetical protein
LIGGKEPPGIGRLRAWPSQLSKQVRAALALRSSLIPAQRIIGKLKEGAAAGGPPLLGAAVGKNAGGYPPTPAMKRFADSLARQKGIKPPPGYKTSISICRAFLNQHAPKKADGKTPGKFESEPAGPAQISFAKKIAQRKGVVIPEDAKANSAAMSAWIDSNRSIKCRKRDPRPPTSLTNQQRLSQQCQRSGLEDATLMPLLLHQLLIGKIREQGRNCGFLMATRKSL